MTFTTLLDPLHRSSTQVPLFTARHLQRWYAHDSCRLLHMSVHHRVTISNVAKKNSYKKPTQTTALGVPVGIDLPSPSDAVNWAAGVVSSGRMAAGQTQAVTPGDAGLRTLGQGVSMANNTLNPYANTTRKALGAAVNRDRESLNQLYRSATMDALITGTGIAAAKGLQMGGRAIKQAIKNGTYVNPSAAIQNMKEGSKIVIHSSPETGLPVLEPHFGSMAMPNENVLFSWNPRVGRNMQPGHSVVDRNIINYTNPRAPRGGTRPPGETPGSVYVAKVPLDKTGPVRKPGKPVAYQNRMVVTQGQGEIIKEIPAPDLSGASAAQNYAQFRDQLARELRKSGVLPKDIPTSKRR